MSKWLPFMKNLLCSGLAVLIMGAGAARSAPEAAVSLPGLLGEVQALQSQQRFADALLKLEEIEKAFPEEADVHLIRGSIQLAPSLRDFAAAEASFTKAAALNPGSAAPAFNLAELRFVKHEWKAAREKFEALLAEYPQVPLALRHLVLFKVLICQLKLDDVKGAEAALAAHFTFMDDTPAYYMAKAALAFQKKNETAAQEWMDKAGTIFGGKQVNSYLDCLIEARWVSSIGLPSVKDEVKP